MPRRSFSLDDDLAGRLDGVQKRAARLSRELWEALERTGPEGRPELVEALAKSVRRLGDRPSEARVVREALTYYVTAIEEMERARRLDEGYAAIAAEQERDRAIRHLTRKAARRWADEP